MTQTVFPAETSKLPKDLKIEFQRNGGTKWGASNSSPGFENNNVWNLPIDYASRAEAAPGEHVGTPIKDHALLTSRAALLRDLHQKLQQRVADVEQSWQQIRNWPARHSDVALNFESWLVLQFFALSAEYLEDSNRTPEAFCEATRPPRRRKPNVAIKTARFSIGMFEQAGLLERHLSEEGSRYIMLTDIGMEFVYDDPRAVAFQHWIKRLREIGCNDILRLFELNQEQISKAFFRSDFRRTVEYFKSCIGYENMKKRGPYRKRNELPDPTKPADAYVNRNKHKSSMKSVSVRFQKTLHERTLSAAQANNLTISEYIKRAVLSQLENDA